ncbi:MAG: hypothetical protein JRI68_08215 [Deltaproteobacteria bacterium]|nr:hypothetical protein [Deltaproteobacteria bacterium]
MSQRPITCYRLDAQNRFVVEDYNWATPFANFFPGIAGLWGIPLWIYYVSRHQGVCSLGVRDKDHQILEFQSFNRACQSVRHEGFRTFLRLDGGPVVEPFLRNERPDVKQQLILSTGELELREDDPTTGLHVQVVYHPLVNLPVAGLARRLTVRNQGTRPRRIECLDGVARLLPYGVSWEHTKTTARHIEAMMGVRFHGDVPLFRLKQSAADDERVARLTGGNFYLALQRNVLPREHLVVDPEVVFDDPFQHHRPWGFARAGLAGVLGARQLLDNRTPCAFASFECTLDPGAEITLSAVIGNAADDELLDQFVALARQPEALDRQRRENQQVLSQITERALTVSSDKRFDGYCGQNFLDNAMRGGVPLVLSEEPNRRPFYVFCRQNGDLERDYHYFVLEPTYLSQGTGHYRSIYQNRRTDPWFFPEVGDANIVWFMNLIQLDGYNPLEVLGLSYQVANEAAVTGLIDELSLPTELATEVRAMVARPFTPGELCMALERGGGCDRDGFLPLLGRLLPLCEEREIGGLHEGFWVDHWLYNLDAIDVFLMVFPDQLRELLVERRAYTFFDDPDVVLPRGDKTVRRPDGQVRRYGAVWRDPEKVERIAARKSHPYRARTEHGQGEIYSTCLLVKLVSLVACRIATIDPAGVGIEMEADKPGWNDSMNGLPALFGSSLCQTLELEKACRFLVESLSSLGEVTVPIYEELVELVEALEPAITTRLEDGSPAAAMAYWEASNTAKEAYREKTRLGVSGGEIPTSGKRLGAFLSRCLELLTQILDPAAASKTANPDGVPYTYFVNEVVAHQDTGRQSRQGLPLVRPTEFRQTPTPLFLEGPVHFLKVHPERAKEVYDAVRRSDLYDRKLKMYRSCVDMSAESFELGRAVGAYPRGWLENESIYLHMEYKYLLEVARAGLFEELYDDLPAVLVPFHDPATYGRSTLEGSSFIVSSAYADEALHGRGFQARLSGITVEMIHLWMLMVAGPRPFTLDPDGELRLSLTPALAGWLFTERAETVRHHDAQGAAQDADLEPNSFAFKLLGSTLVVYQNASRADTWGPRGAKPAAHLITMNDGITHERTGPALDADLARAVRNGQVRRIDVTLEPAS